MCVFHAANAACSGSQSDNIPTFTGGTESNQKGGSRKKRGGVAGMMDHERDDFVPPANGFRIAPFMLDVTEPDTPMHPVQGKKKKKHIHSKHKRAPEPAPATADGPTIEWTQGFFRQLIQETKQQYPGSDDAQIKSVAEHLLLAISASLTEEEAMQGGAPATGAKKAKNARKAEYEGFLQDIDAPMFRFTNDAEVCTPLLDLFREAPESSFSELWNLVMQSLNAPDTSPAKQVGLKLILQLLILARPLLAAPRFQHSSRERQQRLLVWMLSQVARIDPGLSFSTWCRLVLFTSSLEEIFSSPVANLHFFFQRSLLANCKRVPPRMTPQDYHSIVQAALTPDFLTSLPREFFNSFSQIMGSIAMNGVDLPDVPSPAPSTQTMPQPPSLTHADVLFQAVASMNPDVPHRTQGLIWLRMSMLGHPSNLLCWPRLHAVSPATSLALAQSTLQILEQHPDSIKGNAAMLLPAVLNQLQAELRPSDVESFTPVLQEIRTAILKCVKNSSSLFAGESASQRESLRRQLGEAPRTKHSLCFTMCASLFFFVLFLALTALLLLCFLPPSVLRAQPSYPPAVHTALRHAQHAATQAQAVLHERSAQAAELAKRAVRSPFVRRVGTTLARGKQWAGRMLRTMEADADRVDEL
eukprot:gnl/Trimastix_PCT/2396.p1 GENE.gnl/Trimastix_PCT/2396~~gnl/Trimastix_PCT/2396.p1  ORF type:complete len:641 (+),score=174.46 gnl/Trimastix_PCT/2396:123-2045(+)